MRCLGVFRVQVYFVLSLSWLLFNLSNALQLTEKIIGGVIADIREFPSFASLILIHFDGERLICGATYIRELWLLTAAHCLVYPHMKAALRDPNELLVRMGMSTLNDSYQERWPVELFKHSGYPRVSRNSKDIGLIKIDRKFEVNDRVAQAKLVDVSDFPTGVVAVGFGNVDPKAGPTSAPSYRLQKVELETKFVREYYIECRDATPKGVCFGDSGGPLYLRENKTLAGIVSRGICYLGLGIYVNVYAYRSWILNRVNVAVRIYDDSWNCLIYTLLFNLLSHKINITFGIT